MARTAATPIETPPATVTEGKRGRPISNDALSTDPAVAALRKEYREKRAKNRANKRASKSLTLLEQVEGEQRALAAQEAASWTAEELADDDRELAALISEQPLESGGEAPLCPPPTNGAPPSAVLEGGRIANVGGRPPTVWDESDPIWEERAHRAALRRNPLQQLPVRAKTGSLQSPKAKERAPPAPVEQRPVQHDITDGDNEAAELLLRLRHSSAEVGFNGGGDDDDSWINIDSASLQVVNPCLGNSLNSTNAPFAARHLPPARIERPGRRAFPCDQPSNPGI